MMSGVPTLETTVLKPRDGRGRTKRREVQVNRMVGAAGERCGIQRVLRGGGAQLIPPSIALARRSEEHATTREGDGIHKTMDHGCE